MQQLARAYRLAINPKVVAITGSNGKTTTKDMTAAVLAEHYQVHKTAGNYNNEIGLPHTILSMSETTEVLVVELGMSNFGEIETLSQIALPDIAAVTIIGESHLEYLGSRAGIAQAKTEILDGLQSGGLFIYPGGETLIEEQLQRRGYTGRTLTFGWQESQDLYAYDLMIHSQSMTFKTNLTGAHTCQIPVLGDYNVTNALIALAVGRALGVPVEAALEGLAHFQLTANRMEWLRTPEGALLLNDAYNASPTSMKAVIETLTKANISGQGRKMALLGDMRELGSMSQALHQGLSQVLDPGEIPYVFLFGTEMEHLYQVLQAKYDDDHLYWEADSHQAIAYRVEAELQAGDILLVKSSNGVNLLSVVAMLTAGGQDERNHDL